MTTPDYCEKFVTPVHLFAIHSLTYIGYSRYDLIGCTYNMPAAYKDGEFTSCEGELQDVVGTYTSGGQSEFFLFLRVVWLRLTVFKAITWSQPAVAPESLPWQPRIPASSNCVTYSSAQLFGSPSTSVSSLRSSIPVNLLTRLPLPSPGICHKWHWHQSFLKHRNGRWQCVHKWCRTTSRQLRIVRTARRSGHVDVKLHRFA